MQLAKQRHTLTRYEALVNQYNKKAVKGKLDNINATTLNYIDSDTNEETVATDDDFV